MNTDAIAQAALRKAAERLTPELRYKALMAGWPPYLVEYITVEEKDGELYVDCHGHDEEIYDLEYGNGGYASAVIRPFMYLHTENTQDIYESAFEDVAMTLGVFN